MNPKYLKEEITFRDRAASGNKAIGPSMGRRTDLLQLIEKPDKEPNCSINPIAAVRDESTSPKYSKVSSA